MNPRVDLTLGRVYSFDAVDLAANRSGRLSPDQAALFRHAAASARRRPWRILAMLFVAVGVAIAALAVQGAPPAQLAVAAGATVTMGAVIMLVSLTNLRQARSLEQPVVRVAEGAPSASPSLTDGRWWLHIGGVRFSVDGADIGLFRDDTVYRIYHADVGVGSPGILSIEVVAAHR